MGKRKLFGELLSSIKIDPFYFNDEIPLAPVCQRQCANCPLRPKEATCCGLIDCADSILSVVDHSTRAFYYALSVLAVMPQWKKPLAGITLLTDAVRYYVEFALAVPDVARLSGGKCCSSEKQLEQWACRSKVTASLLTVVYYLSEWGLLPSSSHAIWISLAAKSFSSTGHGLNFASHVYDLKAGRGDEDTRQNIVSYAGECAFLVAETFFVERIPLCTAGLAITSGVWGLACSLDSAAA